MTETIHESPELAALGTADVASGDLPIGLRALIDAGVHFGRATASTSSTSTRPRSSSSARSTS